MALMLRSDRSSHGSNAASIECWEYLIHKHLGGGQIGETATVEHEVINAQFDEWLHLFEELLGSTNEILALLEWLVRDLGHFLFGGRAGTPTAPAAPHCFGIAPHLLAGSLELLQ